MNDDDLDYKQMAKELFIEAKDGNSESQCLLGQMYFEGLGVRQDYKQAGAWMTKAAEQGHAEAQYYLGLLYQQGHGVKQNQAKAEEYFQRAVKLGNEEAKAMLAGIVKAQAATIHSELKKAEKQIILKEQENTELQRVAIVDIEMGGISHKVKKIIITVGILSILLAAGYFGYSTVMRNKARLEHEKALSKYQGTLSFVVLEMLTSAIAADDTCSLIHDVWYNTIFKKKSPKTDKYTINYYDFHDDFNTALTKLMSSSEFINKISQIKVSSEKVERSMQRLQNPPEEFKNTYPILLNLYEAYIELANLAMNPRGSLTHYTTRYNNASSSFMRYYKMILY